METQIETFNDFLHRAIASGSNCILIGEDHNRCQALFPIINFLLSNKELCEENKIVIFHERFPALGDNHIIPYKSEDLPMLTAKRRSKSLLESLIAHNIDIYGLEIPDTDPFIKFNSDDYNPDDSSIDDLLKIMREHDLEEKFQDLHHMNIKDFIEENDFSTGWLTVAKLFEQLNTRITVPNQKFCEIISTPDSNVIRIVIVGNTHIPEMRQNNELIDEGMVLKLKRSNNIRELAVAAITLDPDQAGSPYIVQELGNHYTPINNTYLINLEETDAGLTRFVREPSPRKIGFYTQPKEQEEELDLQESYEISNKRCSKCCSFFN